MNLAHDLVRNGFVEGRHDLIENLGGRIDALGNVGLIFVGGPTHAGED